MTKLSMGIENLEALLRSQNCIFNIVEISYKLDFQNKIKEYRNFFSYEKSSASPFIA